MIFIIIQLPSASVYIKDSTSPPFEFGCGHLESYGHEVWLWEHFQSSLPLLYGHLRHKLRCQSIFARIHECVVQTSKPSSKSRKKICTWSHWYLEVMLPHIRTYSIWTLKLRLSVEVLCRNEYLPKDVLLIS